MKNIFHFLRDSSCLNHLSIKDGIMTCSICDKFIAAKYKIGDEESIFIAEPYKKYQRVIKENFSKNQNKTGLFGNIQFSEFDDMISDFKQEPLDILSSVSVEDNEEENDNDNRTGDFN